MRWVAENAPALAAQFVKIVAPDGGTWDFSPASLADLDEVLGRYHARGYRPEQLERMLIMASCYLGEVIRRSVGATWVKGEDSDQPDMKNEALVLRLDGGYLAPFATVCKRVENGAEERLPFYYNAMLANLGKSHLPPASLAPDAKSPTPGLWGRVWTKINPRHKAQT